MYNSSEDSVVGHAQLNLADLYDGQVKYVLYIYIYIIICIYIYTHIHIHIHIMIHNNSYYYV